MKILGNILWFILGGGIISLLWLIAGVLCCCTIIFIPLAIQCLKFAGFTLYPFGRTMVNNGKVGSFLLNFLWILFFGWELASISVVIGILWCITIFGIPFGVQCMKFAQLAIMPFGTEVVKI